MERVWGKCEKRGGQRFEVNIPEERYEREDPNKVIRESGRSRQAPTRSYMPLLNYAGWLLSHMT